MITDYYTILGVEKDALPEQIRRSYHEKAKLYHPDVYNGEDGDKMFKLLNEAYRTLINPQNRRKYDFKLKYGSMIEISHHAPSEQDRIRRAKENYIKRKKELLMKETLQDRKAKRVMDMVMTWVVIVTIGGGLLYGIIDSLIFYNYRGIILFLTIIIILPLAFFTSFNFRKKK